MEHEKRLIDLDASLKRLEKESWWLDEVKACIRMFLAKAKLVDAVEVVRCRDCKNWKLIDSLDPHRECQIFYGLHDYGYLTGADDFCSYGERKDNEY